MWSSVHDLLYSEKSRIRPLSPEEITDICFNDIIPETNNFLVVNKKNKRILRSILLENECDSFTVNMIDADSFGKFVSKCVRTQHNIVRVASEVVMQRLMEKISEWGFKFNWNSVVNAIAHEMTPKLGELVQSVARDLGTLNPNSGKELIKALKEKTNRKLTNSETVYLLSFMQRLCCPMKTWQIPTAKSSLVTTHDICL